MMSAYLVSDDNKEIIIEDSDDELDILVSYKGKQYWGHKIIIESEEEVDRIVVQNLVSRLSDLCELKHLSLIDVSIIVFSGSQETDGIIPTMVLCPIESKRYKTLNQTAYSLDQLSLAKTLTDMASVLKSLHSRGFSHGSINADVICYNDDSKSYSLHPMGIVNSLVSAHINPSKKSFFACERNDVFQFANLFRKMFLDYPSISALLSCTISYILDDCLNEDPVHRPSSARVSDALSGILQGLNSMQQEIDRLKKLLASAPSASQGKTVGSSKSPDRPAKQVPGGSKSYNNAGSVPIQAMQEKRANIGSFDRTVQLFKSKLHQVNIVHSILKFVLPALVFLVK